MSAEDMLDAEDAELVRRLAGLRRSLRPLTETVDDAFVDFERRLVERLAERAAAARAIAEANVRILELLDEEQRLRDRISAQKSELEQVASQLERDARASAEAAVEAVFQLEEQEQRLAAANAKAAALRKEQEELERKAFVDALTGLFNHRYFEEQIVLEIARAQRYGRPLSLLFVDADHFKSLNDSHGHPVGDAALRRIGEILTGVVRASDLTVRLDGTPFAVRYGGEEFVLILPETPLDGALVVGERVRRAVEEAEFVGAATQPGGRITVSVGVASLVPGDDAASLTKRADDALYAAKRSGRNRVVPQAA